MSVHQLQRPAGTTPAGGARLQAQSIELARSLEDLADPRTIIPADTRRALTTTALAWRVDVLRDLLAVERDELALLLARGAYPPAIRGGGDLVLGDVELLVARAAEHIGAGRLELAACILDGAIQHARAATSMVIAHWAAPRVSLFPAAPGGPGVPS